MSAERRKFLRITEHHLLKYRICDESQVLSFVRNISGGGVLFHSKEELEVGATLEMKLSLPPNDKPIKVIVKVKHIRPLKKIGGFNVGAEFVHIEEEDRELIERSVGSNEEKNPDDPKE